MGNSKRVHLFLTLVLLVQGIVHSSEAIQCSDLNLTPSNTNNNDENYSILTEQLRTSNIIKVSVNVKSIIGDRSWFIMGASDSSKLIGSWQPLTSADGETIDCSSSLPLEQAVTNQNSVSENSNRSEFIFYWMAPISFNNTVTFVATILTNNSINDGSNARYIQSSTIQIESKQGRNRYQDVSTTFCTSSPCQNGGTCNYDPQYSSCQCVSPWNGVFCQLQYFQIMLASNLSFSSNFYVETLNSPVYTNLTNDIVAWLNNAFSALPSNRIYSINFVAPSPIGTYISISMALTPTTTLYTPVILSALATAITQNSVTPLGNMLSINPMYVSNAVTQDTTPYTSCVFPFALVLVDYNFCIPYNGNFICSRSRVIDRNATLNSLDCSRNIFNYITQNPCFPNICLNGGTCTTVNGVATCTCPAYFTGTRCDQLFGCNPLTNSQAVSCTNSASCVNNQCVCASNSTVGTLCEIQNYACTFPFTYMNVTYASCAVINGLSLCVARNSPTNGNFPVTFAACGAPQCANNPCGNRGTCQNTVSGSFNCINCAPGYSGYFCELQFQTYQMTLNITYTPDLQNASSNASIQLRASINQTLYTNLLNLTSGGFRPDITFTQNPDGTTSAIINLYTNYLNFLNNATKNALNNIGLTVTVITNTTRTCSPWYIYQGRNISGCILNSNNVAICSITNNFDRDGQYTTCSEPIYTNLCNHIYCGGGQCVVTSRNLTFCNCPSGVTGTACDQLIQCSDVNCLNNGTCILLSSNYYRCNCAPGYGGIYCQYNITGCSFPFVDNQNRTQNSCITSTDYLGGTVPWCRTATGQIKSCQIDYCAQKPCKYGVCIPSSQWAFGNFYPSFICNCSAGFTGRLCTYAYFRLQALYAVPNMSITTLNAIESPTTQAYQNLSLLYRNLVRNRTNSSFDFLPLIYTTFRTSSGNYYQITADLSYPGNLSSTDISNIITPILSNLPSYFNATYVPNGDLEGDLIQPLNPAPNCTLPYGYNSLSLAVCHMDPNGLAYCSYGDNYTLVDRKLCDASGLPTAQYSACDNLNLTNPCNSTPNFPITCVASDNGWTCFCQVTQTLGLNCGSLDYCRNGSLLCQNNATCINRPDISDFACNCTSQYYGRYCQNFGLTFKFYLVNYTNASSPGLPILISYINQTIMNITNGSVIPNIINISPSGEVTVSVVGTNYSIPQFQIPLLNQVNSNWTVGPFLVSYNQTNLIPIQTNMTCTFPFAYNGINYTTCITAGYGFPWCSSTPVFTGEIIDCRNINWCASGPCLNNGTCTNNLQTGSYQCKCVDGWTGVQCAYPSITITIVIPLGNNTYNNLTYLNISSSLPNGTSINIIRPGPNNTIVVVIIVNGTTIPNITLPNMINITIQPTKNIPGCVFPFTYMNNTFSSCIPVYQNHSTYCCQNTNCDLNPQWQYCNGTDICAACAPNAGCVMNSVGIVSCVCPVGYTGPLCTTPIDLCALYNRSCLNNGVCVINPNTSVAYCNCSSSWNGTRCETFVPCLSNPCLHNGTCSASSIGTVQCNCTNCYGGILCEITNYCCLNVCSPNGVCITTGNGTYQCFCNPNYSGINCTIYNPCALLPCQNNGTCAVINGSSYQCLCPTGYTGVNCATVVNPCSSTPCLNNGQCITLGNQFVCICPLGFNGTYCQTPINPCSSNPCLNNGICYQQVTNSSLSSTGSSLGYVCYCNSSIYTGVQCETIVSPCPTNVALTPCRNGGTCIPSANGTSYVCICTFPYGGINCDQIIDYCTLNPCAPNGICFMNSATGNFTCQCINSTFTGPLCQNLTNPCLSSPCTNGSTCVSVGSNYVCQCPANRTGLRCESLIPPCTNISCYNNGTCLYSGSIVICLCATGFTDPQCLSIINVCSPSPCLHNGTCVSLSTTAYTCTCPSSYTGSLCETFVNPCLTYPCFFGGTCLLNSTYQPNCVCPPTYTGLYCQTLLSPCLSFPCINNGTCLANSASTLYTCQCLPLYTGSRCENLVNPCLPSPCIYGTCYTLNNGTYYCACAANYTGLICDHPINQCSLNPCVHNSTCYANGTSFYCLCPTGYTGSLCEQIINPCSSNPCRTGTCYSTGTVYVCICDASHTGLLCETVINPCLSNPCLNNQSCLYAGANLGYICLCALPYTGLRCESIILPCTTITCLNGGTCVQPTITTSQCICPTGYTGTYCQTFVSICQTGLCFNNGTCIPLSTSTFLCQCLTQYTGTYCEQYNPCSNYICANGGTCVISSTSVGGRICICPTGYTDPICGTPVSPCSSSPCVNGGLCVATPGTLNFTCICTAMYTGVFCQTYINPCLTYYCGNGGTCYRSSSGAAICSCFSGYTGSQCLTQINPCLSSPCVNNGVCISLLPIYNYTCQCPTNYTGYRCENFISGCTTTLCQNGGTCVYNGLNAVSCLCTSLWTGTLCQNRIDLCTIANPCLHSGICISIYNSTNVTTTACQCLSTYTGKYCEIPISPCQTLLCLNGQCLLRADGTAICYCNSQWTGAACDTLISPCSSQPCLNNGVCYINGTGYACACPTGYSGSRCEIVISNQCTLICTNNGTCAIRATDNTQICVCPTGYTGTRCEIQISACTPSPCLNNGLCIPATYTTSTLGFLCICPVQYTGTICANYISLCGNSTCLNGGTCLISGSQALCQCPIYYTGTYCESLTNPCDSYPCVNGGTCVTTANGRRKRQNIIASLGYYCQCPTGYNGTRCETYLTLCTPNPCLNNGTCYQLSTTSAVQCLCPANYTGMFCNTTVNNTNPCTQGVTVCYNGGTCIVNASAPRGFFCACLPTTTGFYCEIPNNDCQTIPSPCLNNGTCVATLTGHICLCPANFTGASCSISTNPCSSQPCFRNGTCIAIGTQSYMCICPTGYSGTRCEICNCACNIYPCLNGGICQTTTGGGVQCTCPAGYTGVRCEISSLPCDSNPCLNGGVCLYNPTTLNMTCQCCGLTTGTFCQTLINPCNTSIPYCFNNGTCVLNALSYPTCICPSTFTGNFCQTYSNPCSTVTCIQGTCVMLANSSFLCICPVGRSGTFCEIVDQCATIPGTIAPCQNGGTCVRLAGIAYSCICPSGFTGTTCNIANPCSSMPCAANATCATLINGSAYCVCPPGFTGSRCNQTITGSFCSSSPCQNNGTCNGTSCICPINTSGLTCNVTSTPCPTSSRPNLNCNNGGTCVPKFGCFCQVGYAGDDCNTVLPGNCTILTCLNGGTCVQMLNGTIICICYAGYTGARCDTSVSICSPTPCQNNGTCIASGTTAYVCVCPPNFTGAQCNLVTNACLYSPCINNGTCVQIQTGGYSCICPLLFTGTQCQSAINPCSPSPCNTGTCVIASNANGYVCYCPPQLTGLTCLAANPCGLQPCLNGGTCVATSSTTYTCICPTSFLGTTCQTYNLCASNPCLNNGTCTMLTSSSISCTCTTAYFGDHCQYVSPCANPICIHGLCQINSVSLTAQCACYAGWTGTYCDAAIACLSSPCLNNGTCIGTSTAGYQCNCIANYTGLQCQTAIILTPCQTNPCLNAGTCVITSTSSYNCICAPYFVGTNCQYINPCLLTNAPANCQPTLTSTGNYTCTCASNPCASNPCQYGACSVINSGLAYKCYCNTGYLGTQCNLPDPCSYIICYNGGTCVSTVNSASTQVNQSCTCPSSQQFVGTYCEHYNPCISSPCMNSGSCSYHINITCFYTCSCTATYTGERCEYSATMTRCDALNITNNCQNGGSCALVGTTTRCFCTSDYTGALCESNVDMCSLRVCQNGGVCLRSNTSNVTCICPSGYQGTYCEYSTNPCSIQPCLNGGVCIATGVTFSCNCSQTMYSGSRCQTLVSSPCLSNPCLNGGTCQVVGSGYVCLCASGYNGTTCSQTLNLCSTIQCLNGGSCTNYGTFAVCTCLSSYTGNQCQYVNQCYPTAPCSNGGTCIPVLNSYSCQCPTGRTGTTCQLLSDDPCNNANQCLNGGTCIVLSGTSKPGCVCTTEYTGQNCEQNLANLMTTTTTTLSPPVLTIISQPSTPMIIQTTSSIYFNTTTAPYTCDDTSLACLAYESYCAPEIEFAGIPCRVLCPRTCKTCCEDFYKDGTCSLQSCQLNPKLKPYCRNTCICKT